ncbi:MAG: type I methionyl aminopeptidase [Candidatus Cloacimonetes bacterium]|nr:type I methionyl aminopeptidase [Candidatus Cloacimonadota bacterium]
MIRIKSEQAIEKMRIANSIIASLFSMLEKHVLSGISTWELDKMAEDFIHSRGAKPAFKGYTVPGLQPFPGTLCTSINSGIVHGIPSKSIILKEGDIIGIDVGTIYEGFYGDAARTFAVGSISPEALRLLKVTAQALEIGVAQAVPGNRVGDISHAIESFIKENGYHCADDLTGHGIGYNLHEDPQIPNIGKPGRGARLRSGMTIAIEPMVNIGTNRVIEKGWEYFTEDGSLSAHFEHSILIKNDRPEILDKG